MHLFCFFSGEDTTTMQPTNIKNLWDKTKKVLSSEMTNVSFSSWIEPLEPLCLYDGSLVLLTENDVSKKTLNTIYLTSVRDALNRANGTSYSVIFASSSERGSFAPSGLVEDHDLDFTLNPKYTFDSFVVGSSNSLAYAASKAVSEDPAGAYNPLFLYGGVGLGKTHLMHAIGNAVKEKNPKAKIIYVTSETFTNEMIQSIQDNRRPNFRRKYRNADVLMVDDIQFIAGKVGAQEEFFNTFNALHTSGKQIVISSDRPPMELTTLEERLKSRFEGGLIMDIQPPDTETRIAILRRKSASDGITVDESVLSYIAEKVNSNIRQLEGCFTRVVTYATFTRRPITVELAETALRDIIPNIVKKKITIDLIQQAVADYFSVDVSALTSKRRTNDITTPRHIAMYLCRELTDSSLKSIGRAFGGRDHTTVMNACANVEKSLNDDPETATIIDDIRTRIAK